MLTSRLFGSLLRSVTKQAAMPQILSKIKTQQLDHARRFHFTTPALQTIDLETYEELEQYLLNASSSLAIFDFYDNSNALSKMQSSRLQSKIDSADFEIDLIRVDVVSAAELTDYFQIEVTPTLISYFNGEAFEHVDGQLDDEEMEEVIQSLVDQVQESA